MSKSSTTTQIKYILDNKFNLYHKIGSGATSKIYIGSIISDWSNKLFAFKLVSSSPPESTESFKYYNLELSALTTLTHPSISKLWGYGIGEKLNPKTKKTKTVNYLILEWIPNGDLFDYIFFPKQGMAEAKTTKILFMNILNTLEYIHNNNFSHRDWKTENIWIDAEFNIKICDFGFASNQGMFTSQGWLNTHLGTPGYASPELLGKNQYYGPSSDVFSLGVILFVLVTGVMPFKQASFSDPNYMYFYRGDYHTYWLKRQINCSSEFKILFQALCNVDPFSRPSISEIKSSKWLNEICELDEDAIYYYKQELKHELQLRYNLIKSNKKIKEKYGALNVNSSLLSSNQVPKAFKIEKIFKDNKKMNKSWLYSGISNEDLYKQIFAFFIQHHYNICPWDNNTLEIILDNSAKIRITVRDVNNNTDNICYIDFIKYCGDCSGSSCYEIFMKEFHPINRSEKYNLDNNNNNNYEHVM